MDVFAFGRDVTDARKNEGPCVPFCFVRRQNFRKGFFLLFVNEHAGFIAIIFPLSGKSFRRKI